MDILNELKLNDNSIDSAVLNNSVIGSNSKTTAGAIKYDSGDSKLKYYNGSKWVEIGDGGGGTTEVAGTFNVYTGSTFSGNHAVVNVNSQGTSNNIRILGNGKGSISFSGQGTSNTEVSADVVKILYTDITVPATPSAGLDYIITHNLGTRNILVNTYFSGYKDSTLLNPMLTQCDVELYSINQIVVKLRGNIPAGVLKVVIYGGAQTEITASANTGGQVVNTQTPAETGTYSKQTGQDTEPVNPQPVS